MRTARASLAVAILVWGCDSGRDSSERMVEGTASVEPVHESPSLRLESVSEGGHYRISARPATLPVEPQRLHDWIVGIDLVDDSSEIPTAIYFDGGMPSHGHGFVTQPRVTKNLGHGEFLVEGVKFHMPGEWILRITVTGATTSDQVSLPLTIEP